MERPQTGQDRSSTSKVIRLNTKPAGQRYAMGMPSYFSSLSMLNAKKPLPHHHDMQGKTILAFRRIVLFIALAHIAWRNGKAVVGGEVQILRIEHWGFAEGTLEHGGFEIVDHHFC